MLPRKISGKVVISLLLLLLITVITLLYNNNNNLNNNNNSNNDKNSVINLSKTSFFEFITHCSLSELKLLLLDGQALRSSVIIPSATKHSASSSSSSVVNPSTTWPPGRTQSSLIQLVS